jgi:hypothetical protein
VEAAEVDAFVRDGFVAVRGAVPDEVAAACADLLWEEIGYDRADPTTWTEPVRWVPGKGEEPFAAAANAPALVDAFDALVGPGRWVPRTGLGSFPLRFPHEQEPDDAGWHVDASFPADGAGGDFLRWRVDVTSRGRALLLLFLFSEVGDADAPTRIRVRSHLDVPAVLAPFGEAGLAMVDLAPRVDAASRSRPVALATGRAGDVFVCHPFVVHAAQPHHGTRPRFLAQPGLEPAVALDPLRAPAELSPVERAIREGLDAARAAPRP